MALYYILKGGGFKNGGANFDAKVRRQSIDAKDLFYGHIGGMDLLARAMENAAEMIRNDKLQEFKDSRYKNWSSGHGAKMLDGKMSLDEMAAISLTKNSSPDPISGCQEGLENIVTQFVK
jgi:xylose isomerase